MSDTFIPNIKSFAMAVQNVRRCEPCSSSEGPKEARTNKGSYGGGR